jgi:hypothetical protein
VYKKHHPPKLEDDVWRLEKIGKDGAFHKKMTDKGIKTVQDFLKLAVMDTHKLREVFKFTIKLMESITSLNIWLSLLFYKLYCMSIT